MQQRSPASSTNKPVIDLPAYLDKITCGFNNRKNRFLFRDTLLQLIGSHRVRDGGEAADRLNSGFDRLMISPGIEFTKVIDEANKRVIKVYFDVEIPIYNRVNAGLTDDGNQGQLVAPVMYKLITSYNF